MIFRLRPLKGCKMGEKDSRKLYYLNGSVPHAKK